MSSKLGAILSFIFVVMAFLFSFDMITVQFTYSDLDAMSVNISYLISRSSKIDYKFRVYISERYDADFICEKEGVTTFGEEIYYVLEKTIVPLIMSTESMTVSVKRSAIVGYYG